MASSTGSAAVTSSYYPYSNSMVESDAYEELHQGRERGPCPHRCGATRAVPFRDKKREWHWRCVRCSHEWAETNENWLKDLEEAIRGV